MLENRDMQFNRNYLARRPAAGELVRVPTNIEINADPAISDAQVISLWLHGKNQHTKRAYEIDIKRFFEYTQKYLQEITVQDLYDFSDELNRNSLKPKTKHRRLCAVKSLFTYAQSIGYININIGRSLKLPVLKVQIAERILTEAEVHSMIALEENYRNRMLIKLLYCGGLRNFEAAELKWRDLQEREKGGQMTVHGKGNKTHVVLIPPKMWKELMQLKPGAADTDPIFKSRKGGHLDTSQVRRIVRAAAERAGIEKPVSPHWLRHSHASHALDRGAPIHLVQQTLAHSSLNTTLLYLHAKPNDSSSMYLAV